MCFVVCVLFFCFIFCGGGICLPQCWSPTLGPYTYGVGCVPAMQQYEGDGANVMRPLWWHLQSNMVNDSNGFTADAGRVQII